MSYGQVTFIDLKSVWRILAAVVLCQVVGGVISLAISMHHFWFINLWIGGAASTLPGFAIGIAWQFRSAHSNQRWIGTACLLGFIAIAVTGMALGVVLPRLRSEMTNLGNLDRLQTETLHSIDVFDRYGHDHFASITDPKSLTEFAKAIADAEGHSPSHPRYSQSWYIVVIGTTRNEFELHLNPEFPQSVIGYFVTKSGNTTSYHGTFESKALRPWVEAHLVK